SGSPLAVYGMAAVFSLAALVLYARIRLKGAPLPVSAARRSGAMVFEGLRYVWHDKFVLGALSLDLFAVLLGGATALLPVFATQILHVGAVGFGLLSAAPAVGSAIVAIVIARRPLRRRTGRYLFWCVAGFGVATIVFGISRSFWLSFAALAFAGGFDMVSVSIRGALVQLRTPNEVRGRVSAVENIFIGASNQLGAFESGTLASFIGAAQSVVFGGAATLVIIALWTLLFPALRRFDRLTHD
ncbi:MAG: MFS transporter, partial [Candidatus Eremiobacteraeota bacterium]|nr:MFS transporter [Candidatus Eremiobacteraeota bacterium]